MTFANPAAWWLLALLPVVWLVAWRARAVHSRLRLAGAVALRTLALTLLVTALAAPETRQRGEALSVVYAIDVSRSVSADYLANAIDWIRTSNAHHRPDAARYVVFGARPRLVQSLREVEQLRLAESAVDAAPGAIVQGATDIEQALRMSLYGFAPDAVRRLVLISDGNQTHGDLWRAVPVLRQAGVRVFTVPAPPAVELDAWVQNLQAADDIRQFEPVSVHVQVGATGAMRSAVTLAAGQRVLGRRTVALRPGTNDVVFETTLDRVGLVDLRATVRAEGDTLPVNDASSRTFRVAPPPRVLYVEGVPESAYHFADALRAHRIDVTVAAPDTIVDAGSLRARFDIVVVSDVFARDLSRAAVGALGEFVREGGGFVFAAGESTFGREGFAGGGLERLLPVRFEARRKRHDLDLVLLIDRSHSMRGRKLELAKTAALSTLDLLEPRHRLAVVGFDSKPHEVVPLAAVGHKRRAEDLISSMTARGQTNLYPALLAARRMLEGSTTRTRHVILLSDGVTAPPPRLAEGAMDVDEIRARIQKSREDAMRRAGMDIPPPESREALPAPGALESLVAELAAAGVTVSTVAIGEKPDLTLLADLAAVGNGRAYVARSDAEVPGLFVRETRRLLGEAIVEEDFRPVAVHGDRVLQGIDFARGPPLRGYVVARPKAFADVLLRAPKDRPLLATTQYGLGRTAAFLSDVKNRWAAGWLGWEGYGRLWAQLIRDTMPRPPEAGLDLEVRREGPQARITLRALDEALAYRNGLQPRLRVTDPDGSSNEVRMLQSAPGHYSAEWPVLPGQGRPYRFAPVAGGGLSAAEVAAIGPRMLSYAWADEYRNSGTDVTTLRALAERTGGAFAPRAEAIFAARDDDVRAVRAWWPACVAGALALFLFEILWRRMPWPPAYFRSTSKE